MIEDAVKTIVRHLKANEDDPNYDINFHFAVLGNPLFENRKQKKKTFATATALMDQIIIGEEPIVEKVRDSVIPVRAYKEGNITEVGPFIRSQYEKLGQLKPLRRVEAVESSIKTFPLTLMDNTGKYVIGDANLRLQMEGYRYLAIKMEKEIYRRENEHITRALKWILDQSVDEKEGKKQDSQDLE